MPAAKRIERAADLIQEARIYPIPIEGGRFNFDYLIKVKAKLKEARELVRLIPKTVGLTDELKARAKQILEDADRADREIFHPDSPAQ